MSRTIRNESIRLKLTAVSFALVSLLLSLNSAGSPPPWKATRFCPLRKTLVAVVAPNAEIPAQLYRQINGRSLKELRESLGKNFIHSEASLPEGSVILDSGGGYSVYGLELAQKGHHVRSINAQDFYQESFYPLQDAARASHFINQLSPWRDGLEVGDIQGVSSRLFRNLSQATEVPLPKSFRTLEDGRVIIPRTNERAPILSEMSEFVRAVKSKIEDLASTGRYRRSTDFAQNQLPIIPSETVDEVIDSFGSFYYSGDRMNLLSEYYRILRSGKKAHISTAMLFDTVSIPGQGELLLDEFLAKTSPFVFKLEVQNEHRTLIMTRRKNPDAVKRISSKLGEPTLTLDEDTELPSASPVYPILEFHLK